MKKYIAVPFLVVFLCIPMTVFATPFTFESIASNSSWSNILGQHLQVSITGDEDNVLFSFTNSDRYFTSSITRVYFEDTTGLRQPLIVDPPTTEGVLFRETSKQFPGGNSIGFTQSFGFESRPNAGRPQVASWGGPRGGRGRPVNPGANSGVPNNGINDPDEMLGISFFGNYAEVIAAINTGHFNIGLMVQSIGRRDISDHFQLAKVPEPSTMVLLGVGLIGLAGISRKRFKK